MSLALLIVSIIICPYFIIITPKRYYLYSLTIFLYLIASVGAMLKIMHWPGGDELLMVGLMSNLLAGTFIIISGIKSVDKTFRLFKILLGILLIALMMIIPWAITANSNFLWIGKMLWCPIFLITGWIILRKKTLHEGEMNLMIVILVQGVLAITSMIKTYPLSLQP